MDLYWYNRPWEHNKNRLLLHKIKRCYHYLVPIFYTALCTSLSPTHFERYNPAYKFASPLTHREDSSSCRHFFLDLQNLPLVALLKTRPRPRRIQSKTRQNPFLNDRKNPE